ncbi:hypothetical protein NVP1081O_236 [Vibrio phage 1.081.O._10N.286.52.C2]|nr:hypothetical protein NVP1081O_236 [Vibrio phage 1.081.O._10N.286.52.C2]
MKKLLFAALLMCSFPVLAHLHSDVREKEIVSYSDKTDASIELTNLYPFGIDFAVTVNGVYRGNTGEFAPDEADHIHVMLETSEPGVKVHRVCTESVSAFVCSTFWTKRY